MNLNGVFKFDCLSVFVAFFVGFFLLLVLLYSAGAMRGRPGLMRYYLCLFLTALTSLGVVFANHLILFVVCWGFLGLLLYLLIGFGQKERTAATAKKALILIAGTDALMILGVAIVWRLSGSFRMDAIRIPFETNAAIFAYLCFASAAFAKAGAMPFHTWIPDVAEDAPPSVVAFLPASVDKLLGIYFLARISLDLFQMNAGMNTFLMVVGSFTIVAAVMMALVQHDLMRLLGYHAVSQVGYMVLGIGTGNPIGIAGGIFHMVNNAIYKSCLFLSAGSVEKVSGTTDLERLGGFAKIMPITFVAFLIASFAISGVPPFNGFASKWMIYQGVIETGKGGGHLWTLWLAAAMFGSGLTLASFMKLVHAVFLGRPSQESLRPASRRYGVSIGMQISTVVLAFLCVLFGVFAKQIPLDLFILPSLKQSVLFSGMWNASLATLLILAGLGVGIVIYVFGLATQAKPSEIFIGGEKIEDHPEMRVSGTEFYRTIQDMAVLKPVYQLAEKKAFDLYELGTKLALRIYRVLGYLHHGVLSTYLAWCLLGMLILFCVLLR